MWRGNCATCTECSLSHLSSVFANSPLFCLGRESVARRSDGVAKGRRRVRVLQEWCRILQESRATRKGHGRDQETPTAADKHRLVGSSYFIPITYMYVIYTTQYIYMYYSRRKVKGCKVKGWGESKHVLKQYTWSRIFKWFGKGWVPVVLYGTVAGVLL